MLGLLKWRRIVGFRFLFGEGIEEGKRIYLRN